MLISDWSSDVCSSDLPQSLELHSHLEHQSEEPDANYWKGKRKTGYSGWLREAYPPLVDAPARPLTGRNHRHFPILRFACRYPHQSNLPETDRCCRKV